MPTLIAMDGTFGADIVTAKEAGPTQGYLINGFAGADQLTGASGADLIYGGAGADKLWGLGGTDQLLGGDGDDLLDGGLGADQMNGGTGNDTYIVDHLNDGVVEGADQGVDTVISYVSHSLASNLENLKLTGTAVTATGNALDNMIFGSEVDNVLSGQAGNDIFEGRWGNDTVHGGAGSDWMYGGEGNDKLYGDTGFSFGARTVNADDMITAGNGNDDIYGENGADNLFGNAGSDNLDGGHGDDRLTGGAGIDYMKGGSGADTFAFLKSSDASTYDFIHDFQSGVDKIDLSAIDANGFFPGNGIFTLIDHSKGGTPVIGSVWIEDTGSVTSVYGDMYGDGTPDFRIDLWDATITQSDLIL